MPKNFAQKHHFIFAKAFEVPRNFSRKVSCVGISRRTAPISFISPSFVVFVLFSLAARRTIPGAPGAAAAAIVSYGGYHRKHKQKRDYSYNNIIAYTHDITSKKRYEKVKQERTYPRHNALEYAQNHGGKSRCLFLHRGYRRNARRIKKSENKEA